MGTDTDIAWDAAAGAITMAGAAAAAIITAGAIIAAIDYASPAAVFIDPLPR